MVTNIRQRAAGGRHVSEVSSPGEKYRLATAMTSGGRRRSDSTSTPTLPRLMASRATSPACVRLKSRSAMSGAARIGRPRSEYRKISAAGLTPAKRASTDRIPALAVMYRCESAADANRDARVSSSADNEWLSAEWRVLSSIRKTWTSLGASGGTARRVRHSTHDTDAESGT